MAEYVFIKNNAYKVSQRIGGSVIQCRSYNGKSAEDRKKKNHARIYLYMYSMHTYVPVLIFQLNFARTKPDITNLRRGQDNLLVI